jgi:Zn-dependent alcohol dehydrogenase
VAVDPFKYRREQTMLLGATHAVASMEEAIPLVSEITRGVMADKTILTVSLVTGDMVKPLLELTRKGGRAVITAVAAPTVRSVDIALTEFILSQKELVGSCFGGANGPEDVPNLMRLYRRGVLKRRCPQVC